MTPEPNAIELIAFYRTLSEREIRRRQSLCEQQQATAFARRNDKAMRNLAIVSDALCSAMLERC